MPTSFGLQGLRGFIFKFFLIDPDFKIRSILVDQTNMTCSMTTRNFTRDPCIAPSLVVRTSDGFVPDATRFVHDAAKLFKGLPI